MLGYKQMKEADAMMTEEQKSMKSRAGASVIDESIPEEESDRLVEEWNSIAREIPGYTAMMILVTRKNHPFMRSHK
jgi:hypothetical protein